LYKILSPISITQKVSILDFGSGDGSVSLILSNSLLKDRFTSQVDITLVDFFPYVLGNDNESINVIQYPSLEKVPENNTFDIIIASAILEHTKTPNETLKKLIVLLKKGGLIYSRTP
jgi:2-polyprenyl-3-methyl-5-hydroxy-6-metoxy-1,4-benzoquinol methylase